MNAKQSRIENRSQGERGSALLATFVALFFLMSLSIGLMAIVRPSVQIAANQERDTRALYVAEAGVQEMVERMSLDNPTMLTVNGGTFNAAIRDVTPGLDPNWRVRVFNETPGGVAAIGLPPLGESYVPTVQATADWLPYASADDPGEALIVEHKWVDTDGDGVRDAGELVLYDRTKYPPENFTTGYPIELVSVVGRNGTSRRGLRVEMTRLPISPNINAALFSDRGVDVRGNVFVDGHNHDVNTPVNTVDPACQAWELCANRTDESRCVTSVMTTGDPVNRDGSTDLLGSPTVTDTSSANPFLTLAETLGITEAELEEILSHADYHSANDAAYLSGITYVNGNATGAERFNNSVGDGLLYVRGNLATSGTFAWKGLIYVEGDFTNTGTPWVLGAIVVKGASAFAFSGGTPDILFSRDAAYFYVQRALGYTVLAWKRT